jgi:ATP-dependent helicase/nuclease subunit A
MGERTIHAFCGDLLHERSIEAGIDPLFEVPSEEEANEMPIRLSMIGFRQFLLIRPRASVALRRRSGGQSPREQLRSGIQTLRKHRDFPAPWARKIFDRNGAIDALMTELSTLGALANASSWPDERLTRSLAEVFRFVGETTA